MRPTEKAPEIESFLKSMGMDRQAAASTSTCVWCNEPVTGFRDALSRKEYGISGLCQGCQDLVFCSYEDEGDDPADGDFDADWRHEQ